MSYEEERLFDGVMRIRKLAQSQHDPSKITTSAFCACGGSRGGPAGTPACYALREIKDVVETINIKIIERKIDPEVLPAYIRKNIEMLVSLL